MAGRFGFGRGGAEEDGIPVPEEAPRVETSEQEQSLEDGDFRPNEPQTAGYQRPSFEEAEKNIQKAKKLRAQAFRDIGYKVKRLILDTPVEVFALAVVGAAIAGPTSYFNEAAKQGQIPVAYAEMDEIKRQADCKDVPLTCFYAAANNAAMEVFEANNLSYANGQGGTDLAFAEALNEKLRARRDPYARLGQYADNMPFYAQDAMNSVAVFDQAAADIIPAIDALDAAWSEYHRDVYRTEYYTDRECDSNGENCRTVTKSRQVYDYTVHTYTYYEEQGELAAALLRDFVSKYPDIRIDETLLLTSMVGDHNRQVMYDSRSEMPDFEGLADADYVQLSNVWASGSNYNVLAPRIYGSHGGVINTTPLWNIALATSESHQYRTYSRSDSGPEEFQIAEAALDYAVSMYRNMQSVTDGIELASTGIPELDRKVRDYVTSMITFQSESADFDSMRDDIMDTAREIYSQNYAGGFDVYPAKWYMVFVWSMIGMVAGGLAGFGAHRGLERLQESGTLGERERQIQQNPYMRRYD